MRVIDIRVNPRFFDRIDRLARANKLLDPSISVNEDKAVDTASMMAHDNKGEFIPWFMGLEAATSLVRLGYVKITKKCPYRHRKCIGTNCSLFVVQRLVGDCAHVWGALK
jgi:hypothetical protein